VAIQSELGLPVKYVGVGEHIDDLHKFNAGDFVNALFNVSENQETKQKNQKRKNHRAGCRGRRFLCLGTGSWWTIWQTMKASSF